MIKEYAIYKGDELLVVGTKEECAEELNVTPDYVAWMVTPSSKKRLAKRKKPERCTTAVVLTEDD